MFSREMLHLGKKHLTRAKEKLNLLLSEEVITNYHLCVYMCLNTHTGL